eukprot:scaffold1199_cov265-Pinguiococcus_pyrenoidosus.AAC.12
MAPSFLSQEQVLNRLPPAKGELDEMMLIYDTKYGVEQEDAEVLVNTMAKYNDLFVNVMMVEELGLMVRRILFCFVRGGRGRPELTRLTSPRHL